MSLGPLSSPKTTIAGVAALLWAAFDFWHSHGVNYDANVAALMTGLVGIFGKDWDVSSVPPK